MAKWTITHYDEFWEYDEEHHTLHQKDMEFSYTEEIPDDEKPWWEDEKFTEKTEDYECGYELDDTTPNRVVIYNVFGHNDAVRKFEAAGGWERFEKNLGTDKWS